MALSSARESEAKFLALNDGEAEEDEYANKTAMQKILSVATSTVLALAVMFVFMVAIEFSGEGFTLALGCSTKGAFSFADNPIAGLMVGTIATALLHSSSTVTSNVDRRGARGCRRHDDPSGRVRDHGRQQWHLCDLHHGRVRAGRRPRAMAAATVLDMYNIWSVIVMLPLEVVLHPLERLSVAMSNAKTEGGSFKSPLDVVVNPLVEQTIVVTKTGIYDIATGTKVCKPGQSFVSGGVFEGFKSLSDTAVGALYTLVKMLARVFLGPTKRLLCKVLNFNGYLNLVVGTAIAFAVHSSTVVTSTLTPLAGLGAVTLEQVYPIVIGANLGTTGTVLLAALVAGKSDSVAIALVHFWLNVLGIVLFYPIPITRKPIYDWAKALAYYSACWSLSAVVFLVLLFLVIPGILMVLAHMCTASATGVEIAGYVLSSISAVAFGRLVIWYHKMGGYEMWLAFVERKHDERDAQKAAEHTDGGKTSAVDVDTAYFS